MDFPGQAAVAAGQGQSQPGPPAPLMTAHFSICCRRRIAAVGLCFVAQPAAWSGEKVLVVGDSLTKEYRSEFVVLYPDRPAAWEARNWIELMDARRNDHFDLGSWQVFPDWRLTGHEFNWAKPGGTAREFRNFLRQDPAAEAETKTSSAGEFAWVFYPTWRNTFTGKVGQAEKVVIFFGGNDLALGNSDPVANPDYNGSPKQVDYESIYAGTFGDASDPDRLRTSIRSNVKSVIQWFRNPKTNGNPPRYSGPMVLCAVPHVGATPKLQREAGKDPARTAVLTQMIETLNLELKDFAESMDVVFADIYPVTKRVLDPAPFEIGGVTFFKEADDDCRPRYLFSGDGFHPNTALQAKVAQVVTGAFLRGYPGRWPDLQPLTDREIITGVLGMAADTGFREWLAAEGVPADRRGPLDDPDGDGIVNLLEYALANRRPAAQDDAAPVVVVRSADGVQAVWRPRFADNAYLRLIPEVSTDFREWRPVDAGSITAGGDGSLAVIIPQAPGGGAFFRLRAGVIP